MDSMQARGHLSRLVFGAMAAETLFTAARFGIADLLGGGESTGAILAERLDTDPAATVRLLRALAALDVVTETAPGQFRLTEAGSLLRTDRPDSLHSFVSMFGDRAMLAAWRELDEAVRSGQTTFDRVFGTTFFGYLADHPELSSRFNAAMRQGTALTAAQLPSAYDFSRVHSVVDVGGGDGTLLAAVLVAHPHLHGVLFDTAEGLAQADTTLHAAGVGDRCRIQIGDFFEHAPENADLYLLKSVIHDWDDDRCRVILGHIRETISAAGKLVIVEPVLPSVVDASLPPQMYLSDLNMLVNVGGRERTYPEFVDLAAGAGFSLTSATPLPSPSAFSLLEAEPIP